MLWSCDFVFCAYLVSNGFLILRFALYFGVFEVLYCCLFSGALYLLFLVIIYIVIYSVSTAFSPDCVCKKLSQSNQCFVKLMNASVFPGFS